MQGWQPSTRVFLRAKIPGGAAYLCQVNSRYDYTLLYVRSPVPMYDRLVIFSDSQRAHEVAQRAFATCDASTVGVAVEDVTVVPLNLCPPAFKALGRVSATPELLCIYEALMRGGVEYPLTTSLLHRYAAEGGLKLTGMLSSGMLADDDDQTVITVGPHKHWTSPVLSLDSRYRASAFTAVFRSLAGRELTDAEYEEANYTLHTDGLQPSPSWELVRDQPIRPPAGEVDLTGLYEV